jgi:hypothetical protein
MIEINVVKPAQSVVWAKRNVPADDFNARAD